MRMRVPKKVNVLGHWYRVEFIDRDKFQAKDGRSGECEWPSRVIRIAKDLKSNREYAWAVFLHELNHALQYENGDFQILQPQTIEKHADGFSSFVISLQKQGVL